MQPSAPRCFLQLLTTGPSDTTALVGPSPLPSSFYPHRYPIPALTPILPLPTPPSPTPAAITRPYCLYPLPAVLTLATRLLPSTPPGAASASTTILFLSRKDSPAIVASSVTNSVVAVPRNPFRNNCSKHRWPSNQDRNPRRSLSPSSFSVPHGFPLLRLITATTPALIAAFQQIATMISSLETRLLPFFFPALATACVLPVTHPLDFLYCHCSDHNSQRLRPSLPPSDPQQRFLLPTQQQLSLPSSLDTEKPPMHTPLADLLQRSTLSSSRPQQQILPTHHCPPALAVAVAASTTSSLQHYCTTALLTTSVTAANTE
ncbi:hypothetical protein BHM03_00009429 [Ensete ventricosum]|nr:hypothetical protein BHM03_00009429 [Ensete ventricosum]